MNIIPATSIEAEEIYLLLYETALWIKPKCETQWPLEWLEAKKQDIFESVSQGNFYTVYTNEELSAVVEIRDEPEAIWNYDRASAYYIHKLAVRREYGGMGLGREVLHAIFDLAKLNGVSLVRLDCVTVNKKLQKYYASIGLNLVGSEFDEGTEVTLYELAV